MEVYQALVKLLDGRTQCLQFSSPTICGLYLKQKVCKSTGIPVEFIRLVSGCHEISDEAVLYASENALFPSFSILSRLRGGKGGFGSLLRGAATKAGQKKTNNFDACRDMSGRRLRHVNAEKKLEEWQAEAEERKLEKIAENFLKKNAKEVKGTKSKDTEKYIEKYREESAKCMEGVEASVRDSFKLYENSKRKILPASGPAKRVKIWTGKGKEVDSDSDDEEADDEKSVVLNNGESSFQNEKDDGSSVSVSVNHSDGESSGGSSSQSVEVIRSFKQEGLHTLEDCYNKASNIDVNASTEFKPDNTIVGEVDQSLEVKIKPDNSSCGVENNEADQSPEVNVSVESSKSGLSAESTREDAKKSAEISLSCQEHSSVQGPIVSNLNGPLSFDEFSCAADMEVLGAERLKVELQARGLKFGGTLLERAARLFLLKSTPLDKLPKKLLAKPASK